MAADAIIEGLEKRNVSGEQLGKWTPVFQGGVERLSKLVEAFYTPGFSFGEFLRAHPDQHGHIVDILIGAVFKPDVAELFEKMGDVLPPSELEPASA